MKRKLSLSTAAMTFFGILLAAACLYAGTTVPDEIQMENQAYDEHKQSIVTFTHKRHVTDHATANPDLFKNGCGECHHDDSNQPLTLSEGDEVQNCLECHATPGNPPNKGPAHQPHAAPVNPPHEATVTPPKTKPEAPKLTAEEKAAKLEYHAYAIHMSCKGCHDAYNKASGTKDAPASCTKCHPEKS